MEKRDIFVLFGGQSSEYEVSLKSAYQILLAIDDKKYNVHKIGITRQGEWYLFKGKIEEILEDSWHKNEKNVPICVDFSSKSFVIEGKRLRPSVALPIMHGEYGEDGRVQSLFELLGIKCALVDSACASLCMDKHLCKCVALSSLIPVAPYIVVNEQDYSYEKLLLEIGEGECDLFVKPSRGGSSVGISHIRSTRELEGAMSRAFEICDTVLIEEAILGKECEVAILENNGQMIVSEVGEISHESDFYDYETKYHSNGVKYHIPAKISQKCAEECRDFAKSLFSLLGCSGLARVDFLVREDEVFFNEINAIPGFTKSSMYPMLLERKGFALNAIIDALL